MPDVVTLKLAKKYTDQEIANAELEAGSVSVASLLGVSGAVVKLVYRSANTRWELPDGTAPTLTSRAASIIWEGTSEQIPSQGTEDAEFQEGDVALVRAESL